MTSLTTTTTTPPTTFVDPSTQVVVIVDPYSTGCLIAQEVQKRGYRVLALWTIGFSPVMKTHVPLSCENLTYYAQVEQAATLAETEAACRAVLPADMNIVACFAGGEAGVDLADAFSEYLKLRSNGTEIPNRRDKKVQQELIAARNLRAVRQAGGTTLADVEQFLQTEEYPIVLKPVESAGSDGVKLCHDYTEAAEHFNLLMKSQMVNGGEVPAVLCQEFLRGKEYVVDHVSRDGVHKTAMVWVYDKRPANGSAFVYYGCVPVPIDSPEAQIIIPYVRQVLDALGLKNGPSHGEVILTKDGPCLVEMNCRARGGDGNWRSLAKALTGGYSQVEAAVDAYLDPPQVRVGIGRCCFLINLFCGREFSHSFHFFLSDSLNACQIVLLVPSRRRERKSFSSRIPRAKSRICLVTNSFANCLPLFSSKRASRLGRKSITPLTCLPVLDPSF